jgi:RHS repeat-associated protein
VLDELVNGAVTKSYTYGLQRISENQLSGSTWTPTFYGYDGHGNVRFTTSTAGAVGNTYQFDAFGAPIASTGTIANTYLYSGERFDSNLNLYHLRDRYYNMLTGRFETMDPVAGNLFVPATLQKYAYTVNNPVNRIDPNGRADFAEYTIGFYNRIKAVANAAGFEAHHIIPARFALCFGVAAGEMLAVALDHDTHTEYDNAWIDAIPQNGLSSCADVGEVLAHALVIYEDDPDILAWLNWYYQINGKP